MTAKIVRILDIKLTDLSILNQITLPKFPPRSRANRGEKNIILKLNQTEMHLIFHPRKTPHLNHNTKTQVQELRTFLRGPEMLNCSQFSEKEDQKSVPDGTTPDAPAKEHLTESTEQITEETAAETHPFPLNEIRHPIKIPKNPRSTQH